MTDTWVDVPEGSDFPLANLPFGVVSGPDRPARVGVAIGDAVLDVAGVAGDGLLGADVDPGWFAAPSLDPFLAAGGDAWRRVRARLTDLLGDHSRAAAVRPHLAAAAGLRCHLPFSVADYVDFYASRHHAENVGRIFRPGGDPLPAAWLHLPIGYHGRAGTVVVSGTPIVRPSGLRRAPSAAASAGPVHGPSTRLDIEAEVGFVVGTGSALGSPVPAAAFADHVFGVVLVNDWSARDLQAFEYVPLGPFLGKSFATSVSPWVVPLAALEAARVPGPPQDPPPAPHLRDDAGWGLDLDLRVSWNDTLVAAPPFATMYWTAAQQLAHLTSNGASLRRGDLFASGTVSGPAPDERGSFLELSENGRNPVTLADGSTRTFLADGDTVEIRATAPAVGGGRLGFGAVSGTVLHARPV